MTERRVGERAVIPLFPLGTVLVPGLVLPLHIFEPRYRRLLADLAERPEADRGFGVVAIREGHEVGADGVRPCTRSALSRCCAPSRRGRTAAPTS